MARAGIAGLVLLVGLGLALWPGREAAARPDAGMEPSYADQIVMLVNQARWDNGQLPPLKRHALVEQAAQGHSDNMAARDFVSHCDLDTGESYADRLTAAGYTGFDWAGENIGYGFTGPEEMVTWWLGSGPHRANLLSGHFREFGPGYAYQADDQGNVRADYDSDCQVDDTGLGPYFHYWTLNFGRIETQYPLVIEREALVTGSRQVMLYLYGEEWATEVRLRNEAGEWSAWQPFAADLAWTLSEGDGLKMVEGEWRDGSTTVSGNDTIWLEEVILPTVTPFVPSDYGYLPLLQKALPATATPTPSLSWEGTATATPAPAGDG